MKTAVSATLPDFNLLDENYPLSDDPQRVIREINPAFADNPDIQNTCAMRISAALNACANHEIPKSPGLYTIPGEDGKRYALRVAELKKYLQTRYGAPKVLQASAMGVIDKSLIEGKKGIIAFDVVGWGDATGHFTLWDGEKLAYAGGPHDYFNFYELNGGHVTKVVKASFWHCPESA